MDITEEQQLIREFLKTKSENLFRKIYKAHASALYRLAFRLLDGNQVLAEDIVQEAWIRAIEKLPGFEGRSGLRTWLSAVTVNCCKEQYRKNAKLKMSVTAANQTAKVIYQVQDIKMDIQKALMKLPEGYREIFILYDMEGFTHDEISGILDISPGTSKSQLFHARKAMKKIISGTKLI